MTVSYERGTSVLHSRACTRLAVAAVMAASCVPTAVDPARFQRERERGERCEKGKRERQEVTSPLTYTPPFTGRAARLLEQGLREGAEFPTTVKSDRSYGHLTVTAVMAASCVPTAVDPAGFRFSVFGFRVSGFGFRVSGFGFGFRVVLFK